MIRRFNNTGRISIPGSRARVTLRRLEKNGNRARTGTSTSTQDAKWYFDLHLDISAYAFPVDARVRVEAWRGNAFQRWNWGSAGAPTPPTVEGRILAEVPETCQFRVSIIAAGGSGLLLGLADKLRPKLPVESLLPLVPADLGSQVWRLDYGQGDDMVVLKVNNRLPDFSRSVRQDPVFRGLVMPQVLRSILERALLVDREDPTDTEGRWSAWFDLARSILPGREPPILGSDAQDDKVVQADSWIDDVVAAFSAEKVKALDGYTEASRRR